MAFQVDEGLKRTVEYEIQVRGQAALTDLQAQIASNGAAVQAATAAYHAGTTQYEEYIKQVRALQSESVKLENIARVTAEAIANNGKVVDDTTQKAKALSTAALEVSRAFEDISTGGVIGGLNNVPRIFESIGRFAGLSTTAVNGLSTAVSLVATGAYIIYQNWDRLTGLLESRTAIPKQATDLDSLEKALKKASSAVDELTKKAEEQDNTLNSADLREYNRALEEQARLEGEVAAAKERQAAARRIEAVEGDAEQERAKSIKEAVSAVGGGPEAYRIISEELFRRNTGVTADVIPYNEGQNRRQLEAELERARETATSTIDLALQGDETAIATLTALSEATPLETTLKEASPEHKQRQKDIERRSTETAGFFGPKLQDTIDERLAQAVKDGKADAEIEADLRAFVQERLNVAQVDPALQAGASEQLTRKGLERFQAALAGRTGAASREEAASGILADIEKKRAEDAAKAAKPLEDAIRALEQTSTGGLLSDIGPAAGLGVSNIVVAKAFDRSQKEADKQAKDAQRQVEQAADKFSKSIADELDSAILRRVQRGEDTEEIIAALGPQVANRLGKLPAFPGGVNAGAVGREIVSDALVRQSGQIAGRLDTQDVQQAAAGLRELNEIDRARDAEKAQRAQWEAQLARNFQARTGSSDSVAKDFAHRAIDYMGKGLNLQAAQLAAWGDLQNRFAQFEQRFGQMEAEFRRVQAGTRTMRGHHLQRRFPR